MFNRNDGDGLNEWGQRGLLPSLTNIKYGGNGLAYISTCEFIRQVALALEEFFNADVYLDECRKIICRFTSSSSFEISIFKL